MDFSNGNIITQLNSRREQHSCLSTPSLATVLWAPPIIFYISPLQEVQPLLSLICLSPDDSNMFELMTLMDTVAYLLFYFIIFKYFSHTVLCYLYFWWLSVLLHHISEIKCELLVWYISPEHLCPKKKKRKRKSPYLDICHYY